MIVVIGLVGVEVGVDVIGVDWIMIVVFIGMDEMMIVVFLVG